MSITKSHLSVLTAIIVFLLSAFSASPVLGQATLENPAPRSFQSGIGVISGWACDASQIEIEFDNDSATRWTAGYGTRRTDTQGVCGDTDNGFGLLFNWNRLGDGLHTVRAFADGVEFANVIVTVTTVGEEFRRGASGEVQVADFPTPGATRTLRWQEAQQNFVITDGSPPNGGGTSGSPPRVLENPQPGSFQSGVGVISGWVCEASQIEIEFDNDAANRWTAGYGTRRTDTQGVCGDTDNGFGLLFNWNRLGDGTHTVRAFADGVEFAHTTVTVTTLGEEFARGLSQEAVVPDFPHVGTDVALVWQETQQNFVIPARLPTTEQVDVNPVVTLPAGVSIPNVAVRSLYAETARVLARPEPSLLLAEDAGGTVLLGLAHMDGDVLREQANVEISVESTAVVLVALGAGYAVHDIDRSVVDAIQAHPTYPALISALRTHLVADTNFLDSLQDYPELVSRLNAVQAALTPQNVPSSLSVAPLSSPTPRPSPSRIRSHHIRAQTQANASGVDCDTRRDLLGQSLVLDAAGRLVPVGATRPAIETVAIEPTVPQSYEECVNERAERWQQANKRDRIPNFALAIIKSFDFYDSIDLAQYGWPYIAEVTAPCASRQLKGRVAQVVEPVGNALAALGDMLQRSRGAGWIRYALGSNRQAAGEATTRRREVARASGCPVAAPPPPDDQDPSDGGTQTCHVYREPTSARPYPDYRRFDLHIFNPDAESCEHAVTILNGPEEGTPYRLLNGRPALPDTWSCSDRGDPFIPVYADEFCQLDEDEVPDPPRNLRVTEVGVDFIVLDWDAPVEGAASYNVYHRIAGGTETLLGSVDTPGAQITGIGDTRERCYRVAAVGADGVEGEKSAEACGRVDPGGGPGAGEGEYCQVKWEHECGGHRSEGVTCEYKEHARCKEQPEQYMCTVDIDGEPVYGSYTYTVIGWFSLRECRDRLG